ncbi:hypothetical protein [Streptomyces sp. ME19-01-6]|uniref:hypothetical protein n=1 Tax=Streptomyces sp. ME19-01-6 TaxID=3028686 RepID=UPI0029BD4D5B|nr:hypothetical protein [Streptomyces sp. ME19-01-6]MDX3234003.1 hypothetical protein [Streptomyces sp. ME19-01-6]
MVAALAQEAGPPRAIKMLGTTLWEPGPAAWLSPGALLASSVLRDELDEDDGVTVVVDVVRRKNP